MYKWEIVHRWDVLIVAWTPEGNNHHCAATLLPPSMLETAREGRWQVQYLLMKPQPRLGLFAEMCARVCCSTCVSVRVCQCNRSSWLYVRVAVCVGDIKVLISTATQHQCHCEGTKQHRPHQNLPTKTQFFFFLITRACQIEIKWFMGTGVGFWNPENQ